MSSNITVVITSIPSRSNMLQRALASVVGQTLQPDAIVVAMDNDRSGAPLNRDHGIAMVKTEWIAFLDDDDLLAPQHLERLLHAAGETQADLVYPWYSVIGGEDPHAQWEGIPWENDHPHQVPITFLARTAAIRAVGGFSFAFDPSQGEDPGVDEDGNRAGEDYRLVLRMAQSHYRIFHLPERTWFWSHHESNSMGLPSRVKW